MPIRKSDLRLSNIGGYLSQINKNTSADTIIKFKTRAARCLSSIGDKKNLNNGLGLYREAYELQCENRGSMDPRTLNILNLIIEGEKKLEHLKKIEKKIKEKSVN